MRILKYLQTMILYIRLFKEKNVKIFFLDKYTIKMRVGGVSNKNIINILIKMSEDFKIMRKFKFSQLKY